MAEYARNLFIRCIFVIIFLGLRGSIIGFEIAVISFNLPQKKLHTNVLQKKMITSCQKLLKILQNWVDSLKPCGNLQELYCGL
jgi:hypothetical protein